MKAAYIVGGAAQGLGEGMVISGKAQREATLRQRELDHQSKENVAERDWKATQDGINREFEAGQADRERFWRTGEREGGQDFTSGENRLDREQEDEQFGMGLDFDASESAKERGHDSSESQKEREHETSEGDKDRAASAAETAAEGDAGYDYKSQAGAIAATIVDNRDGNFLGLGGDGLDEYGGNEEVAREAIAQKALEMLEQGKSAEDVIAELSPKAQGEQKTEGVSVTQPRGAQSTQGQSYTRQNPATPQSQEDFDALPKGAFYKNPADGLLYTKN